MIKEDYVSFETAKLLKEKGFDWNESPFYSEQDRDEWRQNNSYTIPNEEYNPKLPFDSETLTIVAPHVSQQMAKKWLREVHNIYIDVLFLALKDGGYGYVILDITTRDYIATSKNNSYNTCEEATEAAIKYCLENLI